MPAVCAAVTFHLVTFAWIFFRAPDLGAAVHIVTHLFAGLDTGLTRLLVTVYSPENLLSAISLIAILIAAHIVKRRGSGFAWLRSRPVWVRWAVYAAMALAVINPRPETQSQFIYLQF